MLRLTRQRHGRDSRSRAINPSRVRLQAEMTRFAKGTKRGMRVLDAGAGRSPYRKLFKHAQYEAADFAQLSTAYAPWTTSATSPTYPWTTTTSTG